MQEEIIDKLELEVKETLEIEEGKHTGIINKVMAIKYGDYTYIKIHALMTDPDLKNKKIELNLGFNANITENSQLGMLLKKAKFDLSVGDNITLEDIRKHLTGSKITFLTQNKQTEKGVFAEIIKESIKFV